MITTEIKERFKGYNISDDYDKLWDYIQNGYRVPAWLVYSDEYDEPIYDIVEVKRTKYSVYSIGTRGQGYDGADDTKEWFVNVCESYSLVFVDIKNEI